MVSSPPPHSAELSVIYSIICHHQGTLGRVVLLTYQLHVSVHSVWVRKDGASEQGSLKQDIHMSSLQKAALVCVSDW